MARNDKTPMVWEEVTIAASAAPLVKAWADAKTALDRARDALTTASGFNPALVNVSTMKIGQGKLSMALRTVAARPANADPSHSTLNGARLGGGKVNTPGSPAASASVSLVQQWADGIGSGSRAVEACPSIMRPAVAKALGFNPWAVTSAIAGKGKTTGKAHAKA